MDEKRMPRPTVARRDGADSKAGAGWHADTDSLPTVPSQALETVSRTAAAVARAYDDDGDFRARLARRIANDLERGPSGTPEPGEPRPALLLARHLQALARADDTRRALAGAPVRRLTDVAAKARLLAVECGGECGEPARLADALADDLLALAARGGEL